MRFLLELGHITAAYALENMWHRIFGEPWVMEHPDWHKLYPTGLPWDSQTPSRSWTPSVTATPSAIADNKASNQRVLQVDREHAAATEPYTDRGVNNDVEWEGCLYGG